MIEIRDRDRNSRSKFEIEIEIEIDPDQPKPSDGTLASAMRAAFWQPNMLYSLARHRRSFLSGPGT